MKYIFFGTPRFAAIILEKLILGGLPPIALICNPDRPVGRKKILTAPATKQVAAIRHTLLNKNFDILQPDKLDDDFLNKLKELNADFYIVAAYAKILKKNLLNIPKLGVIGVHPSLLPKYRGSSPIQSALLNQEKVTGADLFMIDEKVDNGPILQSKSLNINNQNYLELENNLAEVAADMLIEVLPKFIKGEVMAIPQDDSKATFTKKFKTEDGFIPYKDITAAEDGNLEIAGSINAKIKALNPEPGAYTIKDGKRIKLLESSLSEAGINISEIQFEGKNSIKIKNRL